MVCLLDNISRFKLQDFQAHVQGVVRLVNWWWLHYFKRGCSSVDVTKNVLHRDIQALRITSII